MRVGIQAGYRHIVAAVRDELLPAYRRTGFDVVESRTVEPVTGWRFRSHLIWLDVDRLVTHPPSGQDGERMTSVLAFSAAPTGRLPQ